MRGSTKMFLFMVLHALLCVLVCVMSSGCHQLSPATKAAIQQDQDRTAISAAKAKDKGVVHDAQGAAEPARHPISAANVTVEKARKPLEVIFVVAFLIFIVSVGLLFTPLSIISKVAVPVSGVAAILALAGEITLPFFPWTVLIVVFGALVLLCYEVARHHSVGGALQAIEQDFEIPVPSATVAEAVKKAVI